MRDDNPDFLAWAKTVPPEITTDTIWRTPAYRLSLYAMSLAQADIPLLLANRASRPHVDQLLRAVAAISADLDEGYSRSSGKERAHYYEYASGSSRESRGWYWKCAAAFPRAVLSARLGLYTRLVRILTAVIPRERAQKEIKRRRRVDPDHTNPPDTLQQAAPANSKRLCFDWLRLERIPRRRSSSFHLLGKPGPIAASRNDTDRDQVLVGAIDRALEPLSRLANGPA